MSNEKYSEEKQSRLCVLRSEKCVLMRGCLREAGEWTLLVGILLKIGLGSAQGSGSPELGCAQQACGSSKKPGWWSRVSRRERPGEELRGASGARTEERQTSVDVEAADITHLPIVTWEATGELWVVFSLKGSLETLDGENLEHCFRSSGDWWIGQGWGLWWILVRFSVVVFWLRIERCAEESE